MKKKLLVGNWKMYIEKPEEAKRFIAACKRKAQNISGVDVVLAPSFTLLPTLAAAAGSRIKIAGQTVSPFDDAQHTGEVSAVMLKAAGAAWVIVGHSERRATEGALVPAQVAAAHNAGLMVVLCVGETERDPSGAHFSVVAGQLAQALMGANGKPAAAKVVVAYEPVWAIGKDASEALPPAELREMVIFIRKNLVDILGRAVGLKIPILYGGSVDARNAPGLLAEGDISGFLVGRASTDVTSFIELMRICKK